jgi:hypothetical protein
MVYKVKEAKMGQAIFDRIKAAIMIHLFMAIKILTIIIIIIIIALFCQEKLRIFLSRCLGTFR